MNLVQCLGIWVICELVLAPTDLIAADRFDLAFVSLAAENRIAVYELDKNDGAMKLVSSTKVNGDAGSQFFDSNRGVLFLGLRNAGKIVVLDLDRKAKKLTQIDEIDVDKDPAYISLDRSGKWLFTAYYATGRVSCFPLTAKGTFRRDGMGQKKNWVTTAPRAHAILADASNRFVFVPHTGPNSIFQFRFNVETGSLSPNKIPQLRLPDQTGPRHIVFHPRKTNHWFSINEQGSSVTHLKLDPDKGTLETVKTVSTLPGNFEEPNSCADLEMTRDGRFLYAANRGHDSIACFKVMANGQFTREGIVKTEKTPRQFSLSPDDRFLVAAGQGAGKLAVYEIRQDSGLLNRLQTVETGKIPWWITIVD